MILVNLENMKTLLLQIDTRTKKIIDSSGNPIISALCELNFGEKTNGERTLSVKDCTGKIDQMFEFVATDLNTYLEMLYSMFLKKKMF